jgi:hypothetical protein
MPNADEFGEYNLILHMIFTLHEVDHAQWHTATARHLRFFADQIETKGFKFFHGTGPVVAGRIVNDAGEQGIGRGICEYSER